VTAGLSKRLSDRKAALLNVTIVILGVSAPWAAFVTFRLIYKTCAGVNFLDLPWPTSVEVIVAAAAGLVALAWFPAIVWGLLRSQLRVAAIAAACSALVGAVPALIVTFLSIYGDAGLSCVPI
jgi:uncharacterized membrane protein (UPF0182 family)